MGDRSTNGSYPVVLEGRLDTGLSRWQWLLKWLLALPHYVVLTFLWVAFAVLTVIAWFAILFTGRYPRPIFDFNVGVLRWTWRVSYYAYSALGTDRYPPFSLAEDGYPAALGVAYPERLSRGLIFVKWILALPHYLVTGLFTGGLMWGAGEMERSGERAVETGGGLIALLVFLAGLVLAFTGRYPQGMFDLVMGLNRWVYRVIVYVALMRDEYPPFRLDSGGPEPDGAPDTPGTAPGGGSGRRTPPEPRLV